MWNESREGVMKRSELLRRGGIAQLGEHLLCKQGVNGSIPFISTKAPRSGLRGALPKNRFENGFEDLTNRLGLQIWS